MDGAEIEVVLAKSADKSIMRYVKNVQKLGNQAALSPSPSVHQSIVAAASHSQNGTSSSPSPNVIHPSQDPIAWAFTGLPIVTNTTRSQKYSEVCCPNIVCLYCLLALHIRILHIAQFVLFFQRSYFRPIETNHLSAISAPRSIDVAMQTWNSDRNEISTIPSRSPVGTISRNCKKGRNAMFSGPIPGMRGKQLHCEFCYNNARYHAEVEGRELDESYEWAIWKTHKCKDEDGDVV